MFSEAIAEEYSKLGKDFQIESLHFENFDPKEKRVQLQQLIKTLHKETS